jgi:3'(2'), 5'-bisphosphate nucleotidase
LVDFGGDDRDAIAVILADIALEAGPAVMEVYACAAQSRAKADGSPVTLADHRAEAIIVERLAALAPDIAIVAEEAAAAGDTPIVGRRFFLVDPLDGTREFIARNGEFTINIGLVEDGRPIAGAVYAPAVEKIWFGGRRAFMARAETGARLAAPEDWRGLKTRAAPERLTALASRSHCDTDTESFLARLDVAERVSAGSSIKFCVVAEGQADVYPRFAPTMEWDTAAGDAVLRAAGGAVLQLDGAPLVYGKAAQAFRNGGFVCWGDPRRAEAAPAAAPFRRGLPP